MSIDLDAPETVLGKVDAALNFLAQLRIARMIGDESRIELAMGEINRHLTNALEQLEEEEMKE